MQWCLIMILLYISLKKNDFLPDLSFESLNTTFWREELLNRVRFNLSLCCFVYLVFIVISDKYFLSQNHRRIGAFELWCWRRLLRVPWAAKRSNQSILEEIGPEYSLEGLMIRNSNTLATWYEVLTYWKIPWCWERLKVGGEGDNRGWDGWLASPTQWTWVWASSRCWWWTGKPGLLQSTGLQRAGHNFATELNWNELIPRTQTLFTIFLWTFLSSVF